MHRFRIHQATSSTVVGPSFQSYYPAYSVLIPSRYSWDVCIDLSDLPVRDRNDKRSRQEVGLGEEMLAACSVRLSEIISPGMRMWRGVKKM